MPSPIDRTAATAKPGDCENRREAYFKSCRKDGMIVSPLASYYAAAGTIVPDLFRRYEQNIHWRGHVESLFGITEFTGFAIHAENRQLIGILISCKQKLSGGIDGEAAGRSASSGNNLDAPDVSVVGIDGKYLNAVVSAVRSVQIFAAGAQPEFGAAILAFEIARYSIDTLDFVKRPGGRIVP